MGKIKNIFVRLWQGSITLTALHDLAEAYIWAKGLGVTVTAAIPTYYTYILGVIEGYPLFLVIPVALITFAVSLHAIAWLYSLVRPKGYQKSWEDLDIFTVWHAACLWAGEEPRLPIIHGTRPYPLLKMLESDIREGKLTLYRKAVNAEGAWDELKKESIATYANTKKNKPIFRF